jgi:hypothetical protein
MLCLAGASACVHVEAGTDPQPLGYGPGPNAQLAAGYDPDPVTRPAPSPWTPPPRELGFVLSRAKDGAREPVPYNDDLLRVCKHLATLSDAGTGTGDEEPAACHARYQVERVFRPIVRWKTLAACLEAAGDADAVEACVLATPRVVAPIAAYPRESGACMHMFTVMLVEQLGAEPMLNADQLLEFEPLLSNCVDSLINEARPARKPGAYAAMLTCIEAARTTDAIEGCERQ